jgi:hypothetical protein
LLSGERVSERERERERERDVKWVRKSNVLMLFYGEMYLKS